MRLPQHFSTRAGCDRGAGSLLVVAVLAVIVGTLLAVAPLFRVLVIRAEMTGVADASALAAADVARGISPGIPCEIAASLAASHGALLDKCRVDGVIVTVRVSDLSFAFPVTATATAGPPATGE
ncbi:MAG: Rv3654c family TadE-like protein [Terrimesophilobacter sp.]